MYAVIKLSGKQYKVEPGMVFETDRLDGDQGSSIVLDEDVLLVNDGEELKVGTPSVAGAKVELEILDHMRGKKVIAFKMKRRKRYRVKQGHRQELTRVSVKDISVD
jgi:large subunit ribosomal protein L21